ncbi:MAG: hypothetical protein AB7D29_03275 [Campylobacterales bacterium]
MNIIATIERDDKNQIRNFTTYLPDGNILCDFYGITNEIINWVENDKTDWDKTNEIFQKNTFLIYETPTYIEFEKIKELKENAIFHGTGLELLKELRRINYVNA